MGRITELIKGADNQIRAVWIKIRGTITRRALKDVFPLECTSQPSSKENTTCTDEVNSQFQPICVSPLTTRGEEESLADNSTGGIAPEAREALLQPPLRRSPRLAQQSSQRGKHP